MKGGQKSVYIESITFILIYCKKKWYYKNLRVNQVPVHRKLNDKGYIRIQWLLEFPGGLVGFPDSSVGKESTCNAEDPGLIPGLGRSTKEGIGYPVSIQTRVSCIADRFFTNWAIREALDELKGRKTQFLKFIL